MQKTVRAISSLIFANLWLKRHFMPISLVRLKIGCQTTFYYKLKYGISRIEYFIQIGKRYFKGVGLRKSPRTRYILLATQHLYALPLVFWVNKTLLHWNVMYLFCYHIFQMILFPKNLMRQLALPRVFFLAVENSSIGDLVILVSQWVSQSDFWFTTITTITTMTTIATINTYNHNKDEND